MKVENKTIRGLKWRPILLLKSMEAENIFWHYGTRARLGVGCPFPFADDCPSRTSSTLLAYWAPWSTVSVWSAIDNWFSSEVRDELEGDGEALVPVAIKERNNRGTRECDSRTRAVTGVIWMLPLVASITPVTALVRLSPSLVPRLYDRGSSMLVNALHSGENNM